MYILLGALDVFGYLWHSIFVLLSVRFSLGEIANSSYLRFIVLVYIDGLLTILTS